MRTLNLVEPKNSQVEYKIIPFPDGQQNVVINGDFRVSNALLASRIREDEGITIKSRLNNFRDLEVIICAVASLRELDKDMKIHLYVPYIVGARSDRKFEDGGNNYLKDVICPIINSLNFNTVTCIDPHSDVLEACIKNFRKASNYNLVDFALDQIVKINLDLNKCIFVAPDAGASKKIYKLAEELGYKESVIICSKDRGAEGKLTKVKVPLSNLTNKDIIIIDDICDGGATFINIAKEIKEHYTGNEGKIYLIVTHGIFSKGFGELSQYFDGIYCTNSYQQLLADTQPFVKQLNVF